MLPSITENIAVVAISNQQLTSITFCVIFTFSRLTTQVLRLNERLSTTISTKQMYVEKIQNKQLRS